MELDFFLGLKAISNFSLGSSKEQGEEREEEQEES